MQLRKPAIAILALALSAGLAQADDAAPAAGSTLDKIAKNGVIVVTVNLQYLSLITTISKKWWVTRRITPTPLLKQ